MDEKTKRHHYVPQFLIKNFTNKDGKILIYDKKKNVFFKAVPNNIFLEGDRNTFENFGGEKSDEIEKMYADLDSVFSKALQNIVNTGKMEVEDLRILLLFAYTQKWRVPQYDQALDEAINYYTVDNLGLGLKENGNVVDVKLEPFFNSMEMQETKRFLLALQPFRYKNDYKKIFKNSFLLSSPYPALLSDCPFREAQANTDIAFEDFIFPIHEQLTLVYAQRIDKYEFAKFTESEKYEIFIKNFSLSRDATAIYYADRFVGCSDDEYLRTVVKNYNIANNNEKLRKAIPMSVFCFINNYYNDEYNR